MTIKENVFAWLDENEDREKERERVSEKTSIKMWHLNQNEPWTRVGLLLAGQIAKKATTTKKKKLTNEEISKRIQLKWKSKWRWSDDKPPDENNDNINVQPISSGYCLSVQNTCDARLICIRKSWYFFLATSLCSFLVLISYFDFTAEHRIYTVCLCCIEL